MKTLILCAVMLSGCAQLAPLTQRGADAYDQVRMGAEFTLCRAISVGAWVRAYGDSRDKAEAWRTLCNEPISQLPAPQ